jgi:hypothetical protein
LILSNPDFFPSYRENPQEFEWYTMENFLLQLKQVFRLVEVEPSGSNTRFIIVCQK